MTVETDKKHWADREERGSFLLMKFTAFAAKVLGRRLLSPLLYGIVLYFFLFGRTARRSAWQYQQRLATFSIGVVVIITPRLRAAAGPEFSCRKNRNG